MYASLLLKKKVSLLTSSAATDPEDVFYFIFSCFVSVNKASASKMFSDNIRFTHASSTLPRNHDRCLSKRCDPGVTWKKDGENTWLGVELVGHRLHSDWCLAMELWDERHATTNNTGLRPLDAPQRNDWWSLGGYGAVTVALGLSAIAGVSLGCPLVYVGPVIWTVS